MAAGLRKGEIIGSSYRIGELIGRGWAGAVYRAEHSMMGRPTALKIITSPMAGDPSFMERFRQAAKHVSDIESPYVAMVHDLGVEPPNRIFIACELVEGKSLARVLSEEGPMAAQKVLDIARGVLEGLKTIHEMGGVHGCLKPSNILMPRDGTGPKIVDYAVLRIVAALGDRSFATVTAYGTVYGEISYLAPEQIKGGHADGRTDVYALALVMYELLTGGKPFRYEAATELAKAQVEQRPVAPREFKPQLKIPKFIEKAVMQALEKDPARRQQTAGEFEEQLQAEIVPEGGAVRLEAGGKQAAQKDVVLMPAEEPKDVTLLPAEEKPPEATSTQATAIVSGKAARPPARKEEEKPKTAPEPAKPEEPSGPRLMRYDGKKVTAVYPVDKAEMLVGRSPDCDIMLDDGTVSRRHARIVTKPGRVVVEDLNSLNGTYINDEAIKRGHIEDDDTVAFGNIVLVFRTT